MITLTKKGLECQASNFYIDPGSAVDHTDSNDLLQTIKESKAKRIYAQHRGSGALDRHLKSIGLQAFPDSDLVPENLFQMVFF